MTESMSTLSQYLIAQAWYASHLDRWHQHFQRLYSSQGSPKIHNTANNNRTWTSRSTTSNPFLELVPSEAHRQWTRPWGSWLSSLPWWNWILLSHLPSWRPQNTKSAYYSHTALFHFYQGTLRRIYQHFGRLNDRRNRHYNTASATASHLALRSMTAKA